LKDYEERRAAADRKTAAASGASAGPGGDIKSGGPLGNIKPLGNVKKDDSAGAGRDDTPDVAAEGMMSGVIPGASKQEDAKKLLPVTPWGRYMKILLSSNEFLFVN